MNDQQNIENLEEPVALEGMPFHLFTALRTNAFTLRADDDDTIYLQHYDDIVGSFKGYLTQALFDHGYIKENNPQEVAWDKIYSPSAITRSYDVAYFYFLVEHTPDDAPAPLTISDAVDMLARQAGLTRLPAAAKVDSAVAEHAGSVVSLSKARDK